MQAIKNEDEFGRLLATDARFFLETLTQIKHHVRGGMEPFVFNAAQVDYYNRIWCGPGRRDLMGKSRKLGFSTQRVGLSLHASLFTPGNFSRIIAHRAETARELNWIVKSFYKQAIRNLEELGLDPYWFIPKLKLDNARQYTFPSMDSALVVDTALGHGIGQSDRVDDLYITEYSEWDHAAEKKAALVSSLSPHGRVTIDFNAKGIGNDAYDMYQAAKLEGQSGWNGYKAIFYGIHDVPEMYTKNQLDLARMDLGKRFVEKYPSNDEEMWLLDERAVHEWDDIQACVGNSYLMDTMTTEQIKKYEVYHGIDTSVGNENGDYQVMKSRAFVDGTLREIAQPIRDRMPEHAFTELCHKRWEKYGGLMTVERNVAQAVLLRLAQLGTPRGCTLFKGKHDPTNPSKSRLGFFTSWASKKTAIADYDELLRNREIDLPSENHKNELRQFEWKDGPQLAGAPTANNKYDDEVMADYMLVQGMRRSPSPVRVARGNRY